MSMAKEARRRKLGPLHPAFNLLQIVRDTLLSDLPHDAHIRASGKLCVSLTRVSDGKNVIVSEFDTREELIERYVDGAISDNLPHCHLKNTITFSAFAGESDVCPRPSSLNFHEVRFNNVSIQVNAENMFRVTSTFFPPEPEIMAEICQSGYMDALRFLQENDLISSDRPAASLEINAPKPPCCEMSNGLAEETSSENQAANVQRSPQEGHHWLDLRVVANLPVGIRRALCKACRERHTGGGLLSQVTGLLPVKVADYLRIPCTLPVESACSLAQRLVDWIPDLYRDMSWLYRITGDIYRKAANVEAEDCDGERLLRRSTSLPAGLNILRQKDGELDIHILTPEATPTQIQTFSWDANSDEGRLPLTPPPTPTFKPVSVSSEAPAASPSSGRWSLGRAVGWIRNIASEQASRPFNQ